GDGGGQDEPWRGGRLGERAQKPKVEVVEVLVRNEDRVDPLRDEFEGRRRDQPSLVRAHPWVDEDPRALRLKQEARLTEPGQLRPGHVRACSSGRGRPRVRARVAEATSRARRLRAV